MAKAAVIIWISSTWAALFFVRRISNLSWPLPAILVMARWEALSVLLLLAHGYSYNNQRTKRAGIAVLVALIVAGIAAQVLKDVIQWSRPTHQSSHGFPSGRTSAAFALASVLTVTFPALGPLFIYVLTALSRLYFLTHFTWDVIGGAIDEIVRVPSLSQKYHGNRGIVDFNFTSLASSPGDTDCSHAGPNSLFVVFPRLFELIPIL